MARRMSEMLTMTSSPRRSTNPTAWIAASTWGESRRRRSAPRSTKKSRPPASPGNGAMLIAQGSLALRGLGPRHRLDRWERLTVADHVDRDLLLLLGGLARDVHHRSGGVHRGTVHVDHDVPDLQAGGRGRRVRTDVEDPHVAGRRGRARCERDREDDDREDEVHEHAGGKDDRLRPPWLRGERTGIAGALLADR